MDSRIDNITKVFCLNKKFPNYLFTKNIDYLFIYNIEVVEACMSELLHSLLGMLRQKGEDIFELIPLTENNEIDKLEDFTPTIKKFIFDINSTEKEIYEGFLLKHKRDSYVFANKQNVFSVSNRVLIIGTSSRWCILFDRMTEWVIVGLNSSYLEIYNDFFTSFKKLEDKRYKSLAEAINNNPGLAWAHTNESEFIKKLRLNYKNYFR